jgi:uncharacterized protein YggE
MKRRTLMLAPVLAVVLGAAPALADTAKTVTATGTGQTRVHPTNRNSNASIAAAVEAAKKASIQGAIKQAHEYATMYAKQAGLTLGAVITVSDVQSNNFYGPGEFFGPFGPNQFCGTVRQPIFKKVKGKRRVVGTRKVHRCFVPQFAFTSVSVTYAAS